MITGKYKLLRGIRQIWLLMLIVTNWLRRELGKYNHLMYSNCKKYKLIKSVCVEISAEKNKKR